jgi:hypothetical protein
MKNRLVRIAFTLFLSSTVLVLLVQKRLSLVQELRKAGAGPEEFTPELHMVYVGLGLAGTMMTIGIGLVVTALVRSRKKNPTHG